MVVCCWDVYLRIFETEMTHVVIDQTEGKTSVHEGQAPLRRGEDRLGLMLLRCCVKVGSLCSAVELNITGIVQDQTVMKLQL